MGFRRTSGAWASQPVATFGTEVLFLKPCSIRVGPSDFIDLHMRMLKLIHQLSWNSGAGASQPVMALVINLSNLEETVAGSQLVLGDFMDLGRFTKVSMSFHRIRGLGPSQPVTAVTIEAFVIKEPFARFQLLD